MTRTRLRWERPANRRERHIVVTPPATNRACCLLEWFQAKACPRSDPEWTRFAVENAAKHGKSRFHARGNGSRTSEATMRDPFEVYNNTLVPMGVEPSR